MDYNLEGETIVVKGREFLVRVLHARGRRGTAHLRGNVVTIRIPPQLEPKEFSRTHTILKERMLKKLERRSEEELDKLLMPTPRYTEFHDGEEVSILGRTFKVVVTESNGWSTSTARLGGEMVLVKVAQGLSEEIKKGHISNLARRVIAKCLAGRVYARVDELNKLHFGFKFGKVAIKEQSTRWGSCSSNGNINLNFKLLLAPEGMLDYVIVHELAHLKEHNHSERFWQLVGKAIPDYAGRMRWLKENGDKLGVSGSI